jgi:ferredoxin--NADP+ reductase
MLYIDPVACVDCGACVTACPVGVIAPDTKLTSEQLPFLEINASYYPDRPAESGPLTSKLAPVIEPPMIRRGAGGPLRVAVVGSGPAAMYAADELLSQPGVRVNVFERLPTPYGLVRAGVAPDHQSTKRVTRLFDRIARHRGFAFYLNVEVGHHLSHDELMEYHHAVIYAVGASSGRRLDIPGFGMPGTATATELIAWINAHPDYRGLEVPLDHERVTILGNGNVALDVARVLTADPERLAATDISRHALIAMRDSKVREVVIAARRGPAESAFTLPEIIGLTTSARVVLSSADHELVRAELENCVDALTRHKLRLLASLDVHDEPVDWPIIRLAYRLTPARVLGDQRAVGIQFVATGTDEFSEVEAGLVVASIGCYGRPVPSLPFESTVGVVPNIRGRVVDPQLGSPVDGSYVAGWIKRGPTGFIGTSKSCAQETVKTVVDDYNDGRLPDPVATLRALDRLVRRRQPDVVDYAAWHQIDRAEIERGQATGRPRDKCTTIEEMLDVVSARRPNKLSGIAHAVSSLRLPGTEKQKRQAASE